MDGERERNYIPQSLRVKVDEIVAVVLGRTPSVREREEETKNTL
jgi:hypothetical protein